MGGARKRKRPSNGEAHSSPAKRRRSANDAQQRAKSRNDSSKAVNNSIDKPVTALTEPAAAEIVDDKQKRKHRPRCHKLCSDAVDKITKALRSSPSPIAHLFKAADDDGMPYSLLSEIVSVLSLPDRLLTLPKSVLPLLNGNEHVFQMSLNDSDQFLVKYAPVDFTVEDATVYLDRLPYPCSARLLERLCTKFGTVVDIRIPISTPAPLKFAKLPTAIRRKGTQHKGFAFVQFACREEAEAICEEFALNHPTEPNSKHRWFFNRGRRCHMGQYATKFAALKQMRHSRMLRLKLRLERNLRIKLKVRQWRREWRQRKRKMNRERHEKRKERELLRKEGKIEKRRKKTEKERPLETPKKTKQEKRREANKRKRKRLSDLKKEAKSVLSDCKNGGEASETGGSDSGMDQSEYESGKEEPKESVNGAVDSPKSAKKEKKSKKLKKRDSMNGKKGEPKKEEEEARAEQAGEGKRKRRCRRTEIRRSLRSHFVDVQAMSYGEYVQMRTEYLRLRKEAEQRAEEAEATLEMHLFRAKNSNHKREEYRDAKWSVRTDEEED